MKMNLKILFAPLCLIFVLNHSVALAGEALESVTESLDISNEADADSALDNDHNAGNGNSSAETLEQTEQEKRWTPSATEFDWVQLTSGEWLKGEIKSMYSETLEFDSDKLDLLSIDMDDVRYLQSFLPILINIENTGSVKGVLNISEGQVSVVNSDQVRKFDSIEIISFAPGGESESDYWWVKFTLGADLRKGNTSQVDFTSKLSAKRRTAASNFFIDYIGNISKTDALSDKLEETINNHRINFNLDRYVTRYFFYTPLFGEYYTDTFQNIDKRYSLGVGIGYTLLNSDMTEWSVSGGPSYLSTKYISVQAGEERVIESGSLSLSTDYESEITDKMDFIFKYKIQLSKKEAGGYSHHIIATLENEITSDFDLDISIIWDRTGEPTVDQDQNIPEKDDFRLILGITYTY